MGPAPLPVAAEEDPAVAAVPATWLLYLLHGHAFTQPGEGQEEVLTHAAIGSDVMHELLYAVQSSA